MARVTYGKCDLWHVYCLTYSKCYWCQRYYGKCNYGKSIMANETEPNRLSLWFVWKPCYHQPNGPTLRTIFLFILMNSFPGSQKKYKNGGVIFMFLIFLIIRLVSLHSLFPATVNLSFFAKSFNKPWGQKSQKTGHNLTLGSSCLQSFKSSLQFYPLWVTLYL